VPTPPGDDRPFSGPGGRAVLALALANLVLALDRAVLPAVVESLRVDLWLTDTRLGLLLTTAGLLHALATPALGALGERRPRGRLLALGVAAAGVATILSGAARRLLALLPARALLGAGEAAHEAVAPALLDEAPGAAGRGRARAICAGAIPLGTALGYVLGGVVSQRFGWRAALVAAGAPALAVALVVARLAKGAPARREAIWRSIREDGVAARLRRLLAIPRYRHAFAGHAAYAFAASGLAFWMPAFLERSRGVPRAIGTVQLGAVLLMSGSLASFAGALLLDLFRRRLREADLWFSGAAMLAAAPLALVVFLAHRPGLYLAALVLTELCLFASAGPAHAAVIAAVPVAERAAGAALTGLAIGMAGDVPAAALIGALSDRTSLGRAALLVPAAMGVSGMVWTWTAWRGERAPAGVPARGVP
jgi:predicted MFS family arabinose efflux permease